MINKDAATLLWNQAMAIFCHAFAQNKLSFTACDHGHTHLIEFSHACGYYFTELQVWLLFEGGYYSGCGFYLNNTVCTIAQASKAYVYTFTCCLIVVIVIGHVILKLGYCFMHLHVHALLC